VRKVSWRVSWLKTVAVAGVLATTAACFNHRQSSKDDDGPPIVLEVENHNWSDINIYIEHDGRKNRLTSVTATRDATIEIPKRYQGETGILRLIVYRIGGQDSYRSDAISIRTGDTVRLTVESDLQRSSVGVW